ncbi:MAG TPA: chloride channel protein [Gammaproteobacteria bacterium]|jgi:H+/Cl- antiporter ClcA|nr:chloride channel protein [Gammaproteobacteria bacterium]
MMENAKRDFAAQPRLLAISAIAMCVGVLGAVVAWILFHLIGLFTNLFYYQHFAWNFVSPAEAHLGTWALFAPAVGGLIVGVMARYGSERIRGHGIPEALEAILYGKSIMQPKIAVLKPLSSAIVIGSGGPFGAEGPIIMTGGALGSIVAMAFTLTANERRTLLVAGAAAGMAATFNTPIAAVLLSVELLLFELRPRSLIPVALAAAVAAALRPYLLGDGALFPVPAGSWVSDIGLLSAVACGLLAAMFSSLLTVTVYACEDLFRKLPIHWMWWPAIGGIVVGIGGHFQPHALGVGYDVIRDLLNGHYLVITALLLLSVKLVIWAVSLGSGTSGGVLAPLLIMGAGLGVMESTFLPGASPLIWPLVSMGAMIAGTMRSPLTAIVFSLELTHDVTSLGALLVACIVAHAFSVIVMKRSILTEKVARRGLHVFREYGVDPLGTLFVHDIMTSKVESIPADLTPVEARDRYFDLATQRHRAYPVVDVEGRLLGLLTRADIQRYCEEDPARSLAAWFKDAVPASVTPDETGQEAASRMALENLDRLPVVSDDGQRRLLGMLTRFDVVKALLAHYESDAVAERLLDLPLRGRRRAK